MFAEEKDLFRVFTDLDNQNLDESFEKIKNSSFMYSKTKSRFLAHSLITTSQWRFKVHNHIFIAQKIYQDFPEFKQVLFSELTRPMKYSYLVSFIHRFFFLRKLYKIGIFTIDDIIHYIDSYLNHTQIFFIPQIAFMIYYFFPELIKKDFQKTKSYVNYLYSIATLGTSILQTHILNRLMILTGQKVDQETSKYSYLNIDLIDESPESKQRISDFEFFLDNGFLRSSHFDILLNDDINELVQLSTDPDFDKKCTSILCMPYQSFQSNDLYSLSAQFGALKCFKFFVLNEKYAEHAKEKLLSDAVIGGNLEIIRICEQIGQCNYESALFESIRYLRYDIFDWLFFNKIPQLSANSKDNCSLIAAASNNFIVLETLINNGFEFNILEVDDDETNSLIECLVMFNHETFIEILIRNTNVVLTKEQYKMLDVDFAKKIFKIIKSRKKQK